jgi:hypothetical protein
MKPDITDKFKRNGVMSYGPPTKVPPCTSWWMETDREGFTARCHQEHPRQLQSRYAHRRLSLEGEHWGFPKAKKSSAEVDQV